MSDFFARRAATRAFRHRDFRLLFLGSLAVAGLTPLHYLTLVFWMNDADPDRAVLYTGLSIAARGTGMLLFGLFGGVLADRFERRHLLLIVQATALGAHALLAAVMLFAPTETPTVVVVLGLTFVSAGLMALDLPTRSAALPDVVGRDDLNNAMSLQMLAQQAALPVMAPLAGFLSDVFSPAAVFAGSLAVWGAILPLVVRLRFRSEGTADRSAGVIRNIREGISYTVRHEVLLGIFAVVLVMQVVGMPGAGSLMPVWASDVLGMSTTQVGFMAMTWGIGAALCSVYFAQNGHLLNRVQTVWVCVLIFSVSAIVFSHSRIVPLSVVSIVVLAVGQGGTQVAAATMVQHVVHDDMRGRVLGLMQLTMGFSMLNAAPVSALGQVVGLEVVVTALSWASLLLTVAVIALIPSLRGKGRGSGQGPDIAFVPPSPAEAP